MNSVELILAQRKAFFEGTEMVLQGIKPEWFDVKPLPELMSFGEQIDHISAVEAEILDETATALKLDKIPFDFKPSKDLETSLSQWRRIHNLGDDFILRLDDDKLDSRFLTVSHAHVSVSVMINTVIEHEIHHRGEIIAYFRMMDMDPPKRWKD
ncbi:MAG: DinB family protein [Candidatus Zixiibacteriota bacterium]|nr:MAG: DinB family protein [candidate division Zixibacteria bacterium]